MWTFQTDGPPEEIASIARAHGLGVILKTHDGLQWTAAADTTSGAIGGVDDVRYYADFFEARGVPFHAWAVIRGIDPLKEAEMAAAVLAAGARSLVLDIEPWEGYWLGSPEDALAYGKRLRQLQPDATVVTAVEPRPWALKRLPMAEFASFSDGLAPLDYWETFASPQNVELFEEYGFPPGDGGVTPEFLLDVSATLLGPYGLPIYPVGQGASEDTGKWTRFLDHAGSLGMSSVSVWRHGVTAPGVYDTLDGRRGSGAGYVVQAGDTMASLAREWDVSVQRLAARNGIEDPNLIFAGQLLCLP